MTLGSLIARLENEQDAAEAFAALGDLPLYAQVSAMADRFDATPAEYIAAAAARFAGGAADEDWLGLIAAMGQADDPGRTALARLVRWVLARDAAAAVDDHDEAAAPCCGCAGHPGPG